MNKGRITKNKILLKRNTANKLIVSAKKLIFNKQVNNLSKSKNIKTIMAMIKKMYRNLILILY